jgi:hypothetical protein
MKKFWNTITIEHLWLGLPFFILMIKGFIVPLQLLDFWWHLKMGEIITTAHSIPCTDIFSFTAAGKPFLIQNWLAEVIYYKIYQIGSFPLLVFFNTFLLMAALLPVYLLCRKATSHPRLAALSTFLAAFAFFANMRPSVFSFVLFAFFYWILDGYRSRRQDYLWALPFLMILWVNLHGSFVVGLGLVVLYLGSESIRRATNPTGENVLSFSQLRKLSLVLFTCIAATLINPESYKLYEYVRIVMSDQTSQKFVSEWQPPRIASLEGALLFYSLFYLAIIALCCCRKRPNLTDMALFTGFSIFALTAMRNSIWFAIVITPILAKYLSLFDFNAVLARFRRIRLFEFLARRYGNKLGTKSNNLRLNLLIIIFALALGAIFSPWIYPKVHHTSLFDPNTPVKAMDYIEQHALKGNIYHPQQFGDYLIWRLYPNQRSFIDGRVHLFGESFSLEYRLLSYDSCWEEKLASFNIKYLLLSKDAQQKENMAMIEKARKSKSWEILFEDGISILFARRLEKIDAI